MLFEPGPIPELAPDLSSLKPEGDAFVPLTTDVLIDLAGIESDLDLFLGDAVNLVSPPELDLMDLNLGTADEALNELSAFPTSVHLDNADNATTLMFEQLNTVGAGVPEEVWSDVPAPQVGPGAGGPFFGVNGPTTITMSNLSRPNDTNFYSGDTYRFTIIVQSSGGQYDFANKALKLTRTHNNVALPELDIGGTDNFGYLNYSSTFTAADVGSWAVGVDPQGYGTQPILLFNVLAGPAPGGPPPGGPPTTGGTFTLENVTTGNPAIFIPGDIYRETVTGPPNQPVYVRQIKDGVDQGEFFVGYTDPTGSLVWAGTITAASIGSYSETVRVGSTVVPVTIYFTVTY